MKNRRKKPGVKLTRAQKKKLEELTRQAKADGRHPDSAQKTIPYLSMYKDGLCRVTENYYNMSLLFDDMNYDLEDEAEQLGIFGGWCSFYSYFDCAVHVQMTGINSENDQEAFARALAVLERNEAYRTLCAEYVQLLQTQYMRSNNGQTRIKLMTFGIESENVKGARSRLTRIGLDMQGNFKKIGVESVLMDGKERLSLLHALFHMDDHAPFVFEWSWLPETGLSTKDFIAPGSFDFSPSRSFKIGETYCAASYIQIQTSSLSKKLLGELLRLPSSAVFSLHVQPMDQMTAIKLIKQKQVVLDATKISEQQKAFRSGYDIDIIPLPELILERGREMERAAGVALHADGMPEDVDAAIRAAGLSPSNVPSVTVFDSCHDRHDGRHGRAIRGVLRRYMPQVEIREMDERRKQTLCCGAGGAVAGYDPDITKRRVMRVADEARSTGANTLVTMCPTCTYTIAQENLSAAPERVIDSHNYLELFFGQTIDWAVVFDQLGSMWTGEYGPWLNATFFS